MSDIPVIRAEDVEHKLDWTRMVDALAAGHRLPKAQVSDQFLTRGGDTLMSRAAWIDGLGAAVKTFTVMPDNVARGLPSVQGAMLLYDDATGAPSAIIDFDLVTKWKTVADSLLGVRLLAVPDAHHVLIVGAGKVAQQLAAAYSQFMPDCEVRIWARDAAKAAAIGTAMPDLAKAVEWADIISCATLSQNPIVYGEWLRAGQHVDLIGSFKAGMREADDDALSRTQIYVDSHESAAHVGEIGDPLARGVIVSADILGDLYDLVARPPKRTAQDITLYKNAGGAHLDLIVARAILDAAQA